MIFNLFIPEKFYPPKTLSNPQLNCWQYTIFLSASIEIEKTLVFYPNTKTE